jgi:uncharacterized membrane protein
MLQLLQFLRRDRTVKPATTPKWLILAIFCFAAVIFAAGCWKYALFRYDGLDLAIYAQTLWKTAHGELFGLTIHAPSYLGDHAELLLVLLAPLYALWSDPRLLILLQAAALAGGAWFLWRYVLARAERLGTDRTWARRAAAALTIAYLASPTLADMGLFEFHFLPFAILPIFAAAVAYERGRFRTFLLWCAAALLVREDVALVVAAFGALAWIDKKPWRWRIAPVVMGIVAFDALTAVVAHFNPDGAYKFAAYYAWLLPAGSQAGATPLAAVAALAHPLRVLGHVATLANLEMLIGLLMPLAFLPLLAPRRLLLAALPLLQIVLTGAGGGEVVARTHYATLFLPGLFLAAGDALLARIPRLKLPGWLPLERKEAARFAYAVGIVTLVFTNLTLGPWPAVARSLFDADLKARATMARAAVAAVPPDAPVAASDALLPHLASRDSVYALRYLFFGTSQFGGHTYAVPPNLAFLAVDADDFLACRAQADATGWMGKHYEGGRERLIALAGEIAWHDGPFAVIARRQGMPSAWYSASESPEPKLLDYRAEISVGQSGLKELVVTARWNRPAEADRYTAYLTVAGHGVWRRWSYPLLAIGPQSEETAAGITTRLAVPVGDLPPGRYTPRLELQKRREAVVLGGLLDSHRVGQEESGWSEEMPEINLDAWSSDDRP